VISFLKYFQNIWNFFFKKRAKIKNIGAVGSFIYTHFWQVLYYFRIKVLNVF